MPMAGHPELPPMAMTGDEFATTLQGIAAAGLKREAENPLPRPPSSSKKPRDNRLRDCFIITPLDGGGENIVCKHCPDYNKTLQKFNPTKGRAHLTSQCTGVDDALRQILLDTTQAAKRGASQGEAAASEGGMEPRVKVEVAPPKKQKRGSSRNRISPAYISFHTDDTSLDVTAPIENGESILRLAFPTDNLKLNFDAKRGQEAAAMCIDGFMNMKADASWTASMCSMTSEGTRAGPHCQWSLNPAADGTFGGQETRVGRVRELLQTMAMI